MTKVFPESGCPHRPFLGGFRRIIVRLRINPEGVKALEDGATGGRLEERQHARRDDRPDFRRDFVGSQQGILLLAFPGLEGAQFGENGRLREFRDIPVKPDSSRAADSPTWEIPIAKSQRARGSSLAARSRACTILAAFFSPKIRGLSRSRD